jgi:hypothetical protein
MVNGRLLLIRQAGQNPAPQMEFRYRTGLGQANLTRTTSGFLSEHPSDYDFDRQVRAGTGKIGPNGRKSILGRKLLPKRNLGNSRGRVFTEIWKKSFGIALVEHRCAYFRRQQAPRRVAERHFGNAMGKELSLFVGG